MPERIQLTAQPQDTHEAILIRAGVALGHNLDFPPQVLSSAVALFQHRPMFIDHGDWMSDNRSVRDLCGQVHNPRWVEEDQSIHAQIEIFSTHAAIAQLITEAKTNGTLGLSAVVFLTRKESTVVSIEAIESVDVVIRPAAGGRFLSEPSPQEQSIMDPITQQVTETVALSEPAAAAAPPPANPLIPQTLPAPGPTPEQVNAALTRQIAALKIKTSGLPQVAQDRLAAQLTQTPATLEQLDEAIERYRAAYSQALAQSAIRGLGQGAVHMADSMDRITLAFEKLMGVDQPSSATNIPRLSGIRELYDMLTGDHERYGIFRPERVMFANATTSTMAQIVANVLNKVLVKSYLMRPQWWKPIAYEEDFNSMQAISWITLGGIADLDTVAEGGSYTEKAWDDYAEAGTWVKKGNYLGLTLEMIDRDDVGAVRALPRRMGTAAARTLSSAVAALFTADSNVGPHLADTYNLFDASNHGNLLTTALSADAWDAVIQAMFKQHEYNSAKHLGLRPRYCMVPIELEKTALTIFSSDREPGTSDNDANVRRMSDAVITVPEWTDANDWAAAADPSDLPGVAIGYRFGRQPELFVADGEQMGAMFTNDEMRIKVRFIYTVGIADWRALHKSNVA